MNERIRQLANEAMSATFNKFSGVEWSAEEWRNFYDTKFAELRNFYDTKFAELIVRECVKFCEHQSNDDEHDEYDTGMWVKAENIRTSIKQHFGVE
jgi:hypothetical protein